MRVIRIKSALVTALLGLTVFNTHGLAAIEDCPAPQACAPCGEYITNMPLPSYETNRVQPYENYMATYESYLRSGLHGFYIGTGFGYGEIDYDFSIPNVVIPKKDFSNSYSIEYITIGFAHASRNGFFIAGELDWYINSITSPFFYEDTSSLVFTSVGPPSSTTTIIPCGIRLDINTQNHVAFDLLPGFSLSERFALYGRLGVEYTSYSWLRRTCVPQTLVLLDNGIIRYVDVNDPSVFGNYSDTGDKQTDGVIDFRLGLGISFAAGKHLSFSVNAVHIFGSKATFTPNASLIVANAPLVIEETTGLPVAGTLTTNINALSAPNNMETSRNEILLGMTVSF